MTPAIFPQANVNFGPPEGLEESQVRTLRCYAGQVDQGSCEGSRMVVTAWQPDERELAALAAGAPIFLTFLGGLPPHAVSTSFDEAISLA